MIHCLKNLDNTSIGLAIYDLSLRCVASFREDLGNIVAGERLIKIKLESIQFAGTRYYFSIEINQFEGNTKKEIYAHFQNIDFFTISNHPKHIDAVVLLNGNLEMS